jgi:hypothetical protein
MGVISCREPIESQDTSEEWTHLVLMLEKKKNFTEIIAKSRLID